MKKTIIALFALAGVAAADGTLLWTLDTTGGEYDITTTSSYTGQPLRTNWSSTDFTTMPGYVYSNGDKKIALEPTDMGIKMADSFTMMMDCKLTGDVYDKNASQHWLMAVGESGNWDLGVAYDSDEKAVTIATDKSDYTFTGISTYGEYELTDIKSITLTMEGALGEAGAVTVYVNGVKAAVGTMAAANRHTNTTIKAATMLNGVAEHKGVMGGVTGAKFYAGVVPEPTTATLSLLALAGLAARRRRK